VCALNAPVAAMYSAGEGGAWGIALLAAYMQRKQEGETLETYLSDKVFAQIESHCVEPKEEDRKGFAEYMEKYTEGLAIQRAAVEHLKVE
ncbi:MAG: ATPase, partial [Clostridiales bacterium]|nr:ATPase [Clostridiales bacterium]